MRNDQPFLTYNYNTDQFTDPVTGLTIHDDGSPTYTQPDTGQVYFKIRSQAGESVSGYVSFNITLSFGGGLTDDTGLILLTNDSGVITLTAG